ncbi:hypothetical protein GXW83_10800 [Streptacidiphilus sp. PB12-B1b]|uniref:hypothetical protein n=1 Tax=Streptacidiphilus sp. PB12-B1b TaxID=2705012 RepID=UPI0015F9F112|nr:hypothetical protein [Streptacidiphilus sp. PB12-B1b]QMU76153.1 hypothetical protein GXW83_10800 [Streptacidiphilus sp. PB12-B1b]
MSPLADAFTAALAAGTLSSLVTTPLWLRSRQHAAALDRQAAAGAAELLALAAETHHLVEVRVPAVLARLTFPHLPVPGPLHPQFTGTALEADHLVLLDQVAAVAARTRQAQPGTDRHTSSADWFQPRRRPQPDPRGVPPQPPQAGPGRPQQQPGWARPAPQEAPPQEAPPSPPPQPAAAGLRGSSAVWSAFQSGTESGRAAAEHRFADAYSTRSDHEGIR